MMAVTLFLKSSIVLMLAAVLVRVFRGRSAAFRYWVWLAAIVALLVLPVGLLMPRVPVPQAWTMPAMKVAGGSSARTGSSPLNWLPLVWGTGSVLLLGRLALAAARSARLVRMASKEEQRAGYSIRVTDEVRTPLAWSFGSRAVLLPAAFRKWTASQIEAAVRHESAHIAAKDCQALFAAELACALYWFNPLVWYAASQLRIEQEHAADDAVLLSGFDAAEYAAQLVGLARQERAEQLLAGAGTSSMLSARVEAILDGQRRRTVMTRKAALTIVAAAMTAVLPLASLAADQKIYKIGGNVSAPVPIHKPQPAYTPEARDAKVEGGVLIAAVLGPDGKLSEITVERSLEPSLDRSAVETLKTWLFKPALKDGAPVSVSVHIEINFRLL